MTENASPRTGAEIQALKAILIILLAIYGTISVVSLWFAVRVFPSIIGAPAGTSLSTLVDMVRLVLERIVPGVVYFFIGWGIFKLIALISRKEPFSPSCPRYIRRIGYSVLVLATVNAVIDIFKQFYWPVDVLSKTFIVAICSVLSTFLIGFGFLVIARILEIGVRLQQDQNLTV